MSDTPSNGPTPIDLAKAAKAIYVLQIEYNPGNGGIRVTFPQGCDDVTKLGMLDMARTILTTLRVQQGLAPASGLVIPAHGLPKA